jgi:hypothetical protein
MIDQHISPEVAHISKLLQDYSFDVENYQVEAIVASWLQRFDPTWISHAITEALYQGRYKVVSVHQILQLWQRRGQPIRHFNREFESIILGQSLFASNGGYAGGPSKSMRGSKPEAPVTLTDSSSVASPSPEQVETYVSAHDAEETSEENSEPGEVDLTGEIQQPTLWEWPEPDQDPSEYQTDDGLDPTPAKRKFDAQQPTDPEDSIEPDCTPEPGHSAKTNLVVSNFQPVAFEPTFDSSHPEPIQPFVPKSDGSTLHQRLKAVVKGTKES